MSGRSTLIQADLHIHTTFSSDSTIQPKMLVEKIAAHPFIKVAAITDHDSVQGVEIAQKLATAYADILIIPGCEISTVDGDILILGTIELPPQPWTVENVVDFAKDNDYLSIAAHPFREYGLGDLVRSSNVDAIEVLNGGSSASANRQARGLADSMNLPGVAGSDAHSPPEICSVFTEIDSELNVDDIISAIKRNRVSSSIS